MTPLFHPYLVNGPEGDPALYIDFLFRRRALLFDIGEITSLPARKILRISDVFISHTHIDHFIGFDHLVRICLGRPKTVRVFGPPPLVDQVAGRLSGYTWNLVQDFDTDFVVVATEVDETGRGKTATFRCSTRFSRADEREILVRDGVLLDDREFVISCRTLDHRTPCLAFTLQEKNHVNIMKNHLEEEGLKVGPWLADLKEAVLRGDPPERQVEAWWIENGERKSRTLLLGDLQERVLRVVPGQKITYVTDVGFTPWNAAAIPAFAEGADYLFIEAPFLDEDADQAASKWHLTARQAGELGRLAGAARVIPTHFSPRYDERKDALREELERAFRGD